MWGGVKALVRLEALDGGSVSAPRGLLETYLIALKNNAFLVQSDSSNVDSGERSSCHRGHGAPRLRHEACSTLLLVDARKEFMTFVTGVTREATQATPAGF